MQLFSPPRWPYWPPLAQDEVAGPRASLPVSLYRCIWRLTGRDQLLLSCVTLLVIPLAMLPLELQRRMINEAIGRASPRLLLVLGFIWTVLLLVQGGLKYLLNLRRGLVVEKVSRELRLRVHAAAIRIVNTEGLPRSDPAGSGLLVSLVAAEAEDVAGFVAESISTPLLHGGTILAVLGYLVWVQPLIAALSLTIYLPEIIFVPWQQRNLNRLGRLHTRIVRRLGIYLVRERLRGADRQADTFGPQVERAFDARLTSYRIKYGLTALGNLLDALGPVCVLTFGGWLVIHGQSSVGALLVFITGFQKVGDPLDQLMGFYRTSQNAFVKYELITAAIAQEEDELTQKTLSCLDRSANRGDELRR